jgi:hypothetical protein
VGSLPLHLLRHRWGLGAKVHHWGTANVKVACALCCAYAADWSWKVSFMKQSSRQQCVARERGDSIRTVRSVFRSYPKIVTLEIIRYI